MSTYGTDFAYWGRCLFYVSQDWRRHVAALLSSCHGGKGRSVELLWSLKASGAGGGIAGKRLRGWVHSEGECVRIFLGLCLTQLSQFTQSRRLITRQTNCFSLLPVSHIYPHLLVFAAVTHSLPYESDVVFLTLLSCLYNLCIFLSSSDFALDAQELGSWMGWLIGT